MRELHYHPEVWVMPEGDYEARIIKAEEVLSLTYGDHVSLTWTIMTEGDYKGQILKDNFYIYGKERKNLKAKNKLFKIFETCVTHRDLDRLRELIDRTALLTIKTFETPDGETKNFVAKRVFHIPQRPQASYTASSAAPTSQRREEFDDDIPL